MANDGKKKKRGFMSLFFEDDSKETKKTEVKKEESPVVSESAASQPEDPIVSESVVSHSVSTPASLNGQVNDDIKNDLVKVIEENNIEGYDYFEFRGALANMASVIPTERDRFKAAFAAVSTMVSVGRLIETSQFYVGVLEDKKAEFAKTVEGMMLEKVTGNEQEAETIKGTIEEKTALIQQLNDEIETLQDKKKEVLEEAINEKAKIEKVSMDFNTTCDGIVRQINDDAGKIAKYLQEKKEVKEEV